MKVRTVLWFTAIVSSILGALVVYLLLSVPNDLRADTLLKDARKHLGDGRNDEARQALTKIVQQYPRTDAAAAATVALISLNDKERDELARGLAQLRRQNESQSKLIADLQKSVTEIRNAPPKVVIVAAPPPKKPPAKKTTTKKKTTTRRRR
ncbi:MAG TPA: hypothetical protein VNA69_12200 [Thermoanaerobaculia bacterium]|nr:hypothetical protein [Thermoanaerobaculia bacterium]